jgi:hypothetical protein
MSNLTNKKRTIYWRIIVATAIFLIVITFTPLVTEPGKTEPRILYMPYTLWLSVLITVALVVLTYIGGSIHLRNNKDGESDKTG